jgi:pimeloyl-ACP methyl ester carboxylesterase
LNAGDGAPIRVYELDGDREAPPIVFGHGCGFAAGTYLSFLTSLTRSRVFAFDTRGHGGSAHAPVESFAVERMADDLARVGEFVARTTGRRPYYVGHSMSGSLALWLLAFADASMFTGFTLFDPAALPAAEHPMHAAAERKHRQLIARCLHRRAFWHDREEYAAALTERGPFALWTPNMIADHVRATTKPSLDGRFELCCAPRLEAAILRALKTTDIWNALPTIRRQIHLVSADPRSADCEWVTSCMPYLAERLPSATLKTLRGTHHISMFALADECRALIELHCAGAQEQPVSRGSALKHAEMAVL